MPLRQITAISMLVLAALIAVLFIPLLVSQNSAVSAQSVVLQDEVHQAVTPTATLNPSNTPMPPNTATPLPSLTPTVSETPIVLYTPIIYQSTYALTTPTSCSVIASTQTYLRGDPSEKMASIGTIFAGSFLNVTGRVANGKWWQVISTDNDISVEGWVRADYVTADSACTQDAVPLIGPSPTPTRVPRNANATSAVTLGPCTLLTTSAASLRPDPSLKQVPLTQIPAGTALTSTQKSADRQWWNVTYGDQDGWIGAGAVVASTSCAGAPTITPVASTP